MKVSDLKRFIESKVNYKFLVNSFHNKAPDTSCTVTLGSYGGSDQHIQELMFQFLVRSKDAELAESMAHEIYKVFDQKSDYVIGGDFIIWSRGEQNIPIYTGADSSDRHIYSVNIIAMVDKK